MRRDEDAAGIIGRPCEGGQEVELYAMGQLANNLQPSGLGGGRLLPRQQSAD